MIGTVEESKDYIYDLTLSSGSSVKYFSTNQMGFLIHPNLDLVNESVRPLLFTKSSIFTKSRGLS